MYKFALIGCGNISRRHAENIKMVGALLAVCDIVPEKANALAAEFGARAYYSIGELLKNEPDVDVVSVCTPNGLHAEHSIASLQAGKHVLCEKPMCISVDEANEMLHAEKACNRKLIVVKSARFNPLLRQLKQAIDQNSLGKVYSFQLNCFWNRPNEYYKDWHGKMFPDGGTLYTQFSHYIDAMLWLFGDIDRACGFRNNSAHQTSIEFEDTGVVACTMANGALAGIHWSVNTYKKNSEIGLTLIAEKGTVSLGGEYLNEVKYIQSEVFAPSVCHTNTPNTYAGYKGSMSHHREIYDSVVATLQNNQETNSMDGFRTVQAIAAIYDAVQLNLHTTNTGY